MYLYEIWDKQKNRLLFCLVFSNIQLPLYFLKIKFFTSLSLDGNCYLAVDDQKTFSEAWQYCDRVSGSKGKLFEPHSSTNDIVKNMYQGRLAKSWIGIIEYDSRNFVFHSDLSSLTWENWSYQRNESCLSITKMCTTIYLYAYSPNKVLQNLFC